MSIFKFGLIVAIGVVAVKNWESLPFSGGSSSPTALRSEIAHLEQRIQAERSIIGELRQAAASAPAIGTVVSRSACGATATITSNGTEGLGTQIAAVEKDIAADQAKLAEARHKLRELISTEG